MPGAAGYSGASSGPVYLVECAACGNIWRTENGPYDTCRHCGNGSLATHNRNFWLAGGGLMYHPGPLPETTVANGPDEGAAQ